MKHTEKCKVVPFNLVCEQQQQNKILYNNNIPEDEKAMLYNQEITKSVAKNIVEQKHQPIKQEIPEPIAHESIKHEPLPPSPPRAYKKGKRRLANKQNKQTKKSLLEKSTIEMDIDDEPSKNTRLAVRQKAQNEYIANLNSAYNQMKEDPQFKPDIKWAKYSNQSFSK